jgi:hypothetical protein
MKDLKNIRIASALKKRELHTGRYSKRVYPKPEPLPTWYNVTTPTCLKMAEGSDKQQNKGE